MLVYLAALVWAYDAIINRATKAAGTTGERQREQAGLGLIGRATTPMKAIWARTLLYWVKDPRYATSLVVVGVFILFGVLETTVLEIDFLSRSEERRVGKETGDGGGAAGRADEEE